MSNLIRMGRPKLGREKFNTTFSPDFRKKLEAYAAIAHKSAGALIEEVMCPFLDEHLKSPKRRPPNPKK